VSPYARNINTLELSIKKSEKEISTYLGGGGAPLEIKATQQVSLLAVSCKKEVIKGKRIWRNQQLVYIGRICFELNNIQISL
jgi:hypothetical protein